jgi:hypothetical protein
MDPQGEGHGRRWTARGAKGPCPGPGERVPIGIRRT